MLSVKILIHFGFTHYLEFIISKQNYYKHFQMLIKESPPSQAGQAFSQGPERERPILVGGGGGRVEKTFLWKTFEVTSCQYLFQPRSKFFKHIWLCEFVPLCFFT